MLWPTCEKGVVTSKAATWVVTTFRLGKFVLNVMRRCDVMQYTPTFTVCVKPSHARRRSSKQDMASLTVDSSCFTKHFSLRRVLMQPVVSFRIAHALYCNIVHYKIHRLQH